MTVYQEAHRIIDKFPEETVYLLIQLMDKMSGNSESSATNKSKKAKFLATAGKIDIDENAVSCLREVSII